MTSTGLLVLSNVKQFQRSLQEIVKHVRKVYIHLNIPASRTVTIPPVWSRVISHLYTESNNNLITRCDLDTRILIGPLKGRSWSIPHGSAPVDIIFSDASSRELCETLRKNLKIAKEPVYLGEETTNDVLSYAYADENYTMYNTVVLGGTFDRIHLGHKILLTYAVLRARKRLVVGVTTAEMTKSKILWELIQPVEDRIKEVREFLMEIDDSIQYDVVPISDFCGPTKSDPDMDMIVVTTETRRGGEKINEIRIENNLRPLDIFCIDLVEDAVIDGPKETKVSSSNKRIDMLGTRIRKPEPRPHLPPAPYIVGLTGGIATGKSTLAKRLESFGAVVIDCDKVAHEVYEPGQNAYNKIVEHFGDDIIGPDGRINRGKLGQIVFNHSQHLEALNGIVWPELLVEVKRRIDVIRKEKNAKVVVIEAAVLLKAGWETECHEIWSMVVTPDEAVQRVVRRNNLPEDEVRKRLANQLSNSEIVAKSNVVFSSQWEHDYTGTQVKKAWDNLMDELEGLPEACSSASSTMDTV